jgi:hypothetical protein
MCCQPQPPLRLAGELGAGEAGRSVREPDRQLEFADGGAESTHPGLHTRGREFGVSIVTRRGDVAAVPGATVGMAATAHRGRRPRRRIRSPS